MWSVAAHSTCSRATPRQGGGERASGGKSAGDIQCHCKIFIANAQRLLILKMKEEVMAQNIRNGSIGNIKSCKTLDILGEHRGVQHSQWCHSMANINLYNTQVFYASCHPIEIVTFVMFDFDNIGFDKWVRPAQWFHWMTYSNVDKRYNPHILR